MAPAMPKLPSIWNGGWLHYRLFGRYNGGASLTNITSIGSFQLHFLKKRLTLHGQGHKTLGQLEDFPWQPPDGGKRR